MRKPKARKLASGLLAIFFGLLFAINPPLLTIPNRLATFLGWPVLYVYIFSVWFLAIVAMAWLPRWVNKRQKSEKE